MALTQLISSEFEMLMASIATPEAWVNLLRGHAYVQDVQRSLFRGELEESEIEAFVRSLLSDFSQGSRFMHEPAVAAVTVVLGFWPGTFAEKFIEDLASLNVAEMPISSRVARIVRRERSARVASNQHRTLVFSSSTETIASTIVDARNSRPYLSQPGSIRYTVEAA